MQKGTNWRFASVFSTRPAGGTGPWARWLVRRSGVLLLLLFVGVGLWAAPALAQHEVTGEVTSAEDGTTLPGVNIVVKGTQTGTTTRSDGTFTLEVPSPTDTLTFSFVGYQQKNVPVEGRSELDVSLQNAVTALEEVVVNVGYQEQTVATTTGSISQVSGEELDIEPTTNLTNVLQGAVPGIIGVNRGGRPGADGSSLLVRGASTLNNNSPLVVINGVPGRQGGLARIDPSNIENVSVLKDASAAIYGSRAANGVILVETKGGQAGETRTNVSVEQSISQPTKLPEVADAPTWMQMINEIDQYKGNPPRYSQEEIEAHRGDLSDSWEYFDTDWYEVAFKDFSSQTTADASVTGGSESIQYRVSLNGVTENGILSRSATRYNQFGFRSNIDGDITDNFNVALNLHGRLEDRNNPTVPHWRMFRFAQQLRPIEPAFWPNGKPGPGLVGGINPAVSASSITGYDDRKTYYFQSNLKLEMDIPAVKGMAVEGSVAYDRRFMNHKRWVKPWTLYKWGGERDDGGNPVLTTAEFGPTEPRLRQRHQNARDVQLRATSTYETTVGDHSGSLLLGTEWQGSESSFFLARRRNFRTDKIDELFAGGRTEQAIRGNSSHSARLNFFGRANYDYQEKYLLELIARYDGSYIFPEGNRFGLFPSVSAGWRLAQEDWFNAFSGDVFDRLKLRASYGQVGNDRVAPYQFLRTFRFRGQIELGDGIMPKLSQTRVPNPDITWEVSTKFDVGLQGAVLGEQLTFDLTYFNQFRDDILWFRSEAVPRTTGFSLPRENIGQVRSFGVEGKVTYTQKITGAVTLRGGANLTFAKNEIVFFAEPAGQLPWQRNTGRPMNTGLYYIADGILNDQEEIENNPTWPGARPGDIRFKDINGDGQINSDDRRRIEENGRPDIIGSFNLGATVGQFDATFQFQGATQVRRNISTSRAGVRGNFHQKHAENRWSPDNKDGTWPRAYDRSSPYWIGNQNTFFFRDAKYLRLKSARLGYTVPAKWTEHVGVGQLQLYLSGRNLFTLTPLDIIDPEMNGVSDYPPDRTFTVGIQMGL